jgi:cation diffusion facilitator CzcD-associated flavoprotein CzcO
MSEKKKVGVIGGGLSGITTIKQLRDEGHDVICFEKGPELGGVFAPNGCYDSVMLTISNYFMSFSDFLPEGERLKFWTRREYEAYLKRYIAHFDLARCAQVQSEVQHVERRGSGWMIRVLHEGVVTEHQVDAVAVCSGMFQFPRIPKIEGMQDFKGELLHSSQYKKADSFEGKRVLCVGLGESSADVTAEIGDVAARCLLSLRRYPVVAPRYIPFQKDEYFTIDTSWITSRMVNYLPSWIHSSFTQGLFRKYLKSKNADVRYRGTWDMKAGPSPNQVITKNERVYKPIVDGKVHPNLSGIKRLTATTVEFNDGEKEEIDTVMFCTGFETRFPFLSLAFSSTRGLYKQMFHPDEDESLAFIGFVRPQQGGIPAMSELQARYFAQLCSGTKQLPTRERRRAITRLEAEHWQSEYHITPHVSSLVNYCTYTDSMAELVGCKPKMPSLLFDPDLYLKLWFGPQFSAQFRLRGPHSNATQSERFIRSFPLTVSKSRIVLLLLCKLLTHVFFGAWRFKPRKLEYVETQVAAAEMPALPSPGSIG